MVAWQNHSSFPTDERQQIYDKLGLISRWATNVPVILGGRTGTMDIYVLDKKEEMYHRETNSVMVVNLPFKDQASPVGPLTFKIFEDPENNISSMPLALIWPVDLNKVLGDMLKTNDTEVMSAEGINNVDFGLLFPSTQSFYE